MFEAKKIFKEVIKEYDKDGKLIRERTIISDGGTSQKEAEDCLDKAEKKLDGALKRMENMFSEMDKLFKDF